MFNRSDTLSEAFSVLVCTRYANLLVNLKVCHPRCVDIKHNVIRTVSKHNSMWYDITNVLNSQLSLATNVIILTTCFGLQVLHQVVLGT
jgi:hypothetical protein